MSVTSTADWAGIYAEHGQAMRVAARAAMGGTRKDSIRQILGKTADEVVGDVIEELMTKGADLTEVGNVRGYPQCRRPQPCAGPPPAIEVRSSR